MIFIRIYYKSPATVHNYQNHKLFIKLTLQTWKVARTKLTNFLKDIYEADLPKKFQHTKSSTGF